MPTYEPYQLDGLTISYEPYQLEGLGKFSFKKIFKGVRRAFTPPAPIRRMFTPPQRVREKLQAGARKIGKANLADWIAKGGPIGIADPKAAKIYTDYVLPAGVAVLSVLPGGQVVAAGLALATGLATQAVQKQEAAEAQKFFNREQAAINEVAAAAEIPQEAAAPAPLFADEVEAETKAGIPWGLIAAGAALYFLTKKKGRR